MLFDKLVSKYINSTLYNSIYLYGKNFLEYTLSNYRKPMILIYPIDINLALKGIELKQTTYVKFYYDTKSRKYKTSTIPPLKAISLMTRNESNKLIF